MPELAGRGGVSDAGAVLLKLDDEVGDPKVVGDRQEGGDEGSLEIPL